MRASIAASATAEPETPPISADTTIATCARPPVIQPVITLASEMMRSVMPDAFIRLPASTNSGTASSGNDCVADAMRCTPICAGIVSEVRKKTRLATPTANATGMPRNISARNSAVSADGHSGLSPPLPNVRPGSRQKPTSCRAAVIAISSAPKGTAAVT